MSAEDKHQGVGGAYVMRDGKRVQVEAPTKDHPEGNRPRDEHGKPLADVSPPAGGGVAHSAGVVGEQPAPPPERPRGGPRKLTSIDT